mgnify:FL=1
MDKIRVLQFPFHCNSGVQAYATNNWKHIDKSRFSFDFAVVRKTFNPSWEESLVRSGAGIKKIFCSADKEPDLYKEQIRNMLRGNYDVVHLHTSFWKRLTIEEIAVECKIPKIIIHSHNSGLDIADDAERAATEKRHYIFRDQISPALGTDFCACSQLAADWLFGPQISRSQIKILKNAIDVSKFTFNPKIRDEYREKMGLQNCFVIGHAGRFAYQKNHKFLLEVFQKVAAEIENARLLLIGEGPLAEEIKELAVRLKIDNKVIFAGQRNDMAQLFMAMDVFCLPSRFEGLGIVMIEAQAAGLPCIASDSVPSEACISQKSVSLPLNFEKWIQQIVCFSKGYQRENMYATVTSAGYNIDVQIKQIEELYLN